ncbi:MAG TPA: hypothetical protein VFQ35_04660 [Polyangiaceae bacterium]|nr:hypothetical protein [Polyangiaceae bacterium]
MSSVNVSYPCAGTVPTPIPNVIPTGGSIDASRSPGPTEFLAVPPNPTQEPTPGANAAQHSGPSQAGPSPNAPSFSGAVAPRSDGSNLGASQATAGPNDPTHYGPTQASPNPNAPTQEAPSEPSPNPNAPAALPPQEPTPGANAAQHYGPSENLSDASELPPNRIVGQDPTNTTTHEVSGIVSAPVGNQYYTDRQGAQYGFVVAPAVDASPPPNAETFAGDPSAAILANKQGAPVVR